MDTSVYILYIRIYDYIPEDAETKKYRDKKSL